MTKFLKDIVEGPRIILVTGHFGSGKTEFSVSLAYALAELKDKALQDAPAQKDGLIAADSVGRRSLALCDLDVENPYFRSRELTDVMETAGIRVYSDPYRGQNGSELQTLDPAILAPIEDPDCLVIMDTGGNHTGAMILNQFRRHFKGEYRMLYIVNRNRPGTDTVEKNLAEIAAIEHTTGLSVSGLVSNSHFIRETTVQDVLDGHAFASEVSAASGLPVLCASCSRNLAEEIKATRSDIEVFPVGMYMRQSYLDKTV